MLIGGGVPQSTNFSFMLNRAPTQKFPHQLQSYGGYQNVPQPTSQCGICQKTFNLDVNLPKLLPCGHTFCLFCLTVQETQTIPMIQIECPSCCIKYQHVPAAHFETNMDVIKVLERVQQSLQMQQMQLPPQMMYNQVQQPMNSSTFAYRSPQKQNYSMSAYSGTPTRMNTMPVLQQNPYDIKQVAQIFENMKLEVLHNSPAPSKKTRSPIQDFQYQTSPINRSPNQLPVQLCTRQGCRKPRLTVMDGLATLAYCSKQCDDLDQNKGAFVRNQDDLYRQASRQQAKSRSKSPMRYQNFASDGFSPLRGNQSRSPHRTNTAYNSLKRQPIFSSDDSAFESDTYYTPQINRQNTLPNQQVLSQQDTMVRQLNFDSGRRTSNQLQHTMGGFGESAFEKFIQSQKKENPYQQSNFSTGNFDTPSTQAFSQYANNPTSFQFNRQNTAPTIHQQYQYQHSQPESRVLDQRLDLALAPNDPMKCINQLCRNRKFLLNGNYLPVCSRKCATQLNIAFNQ